MKGRVVYLHRNQRNGDIFYVGQGANRGRAYEEYNRVPEWNKIVDKDYFDVEIVAHEISKDDANELEEFLIEVIGIENITNRTLGGDGTKGYRHTKATKKKIADAVKKRPKDVVAKSARKAWLTRTLSLSEKYQHIDGGEIIYSLALACELHNIDYKAEWQRQHRKSVNRNFNKIK